MMRQNVNRGRTIGARLVLILTALSFSFAFVVFLWAMVAVFAGALPWPALPLLLAISVALFIHASGIYFAHSMSPGQIRHHGLEQLVKRTVSSPEEIDSALEQLCDELDEHPLATKSHRAELRDWLVSVDDTELSTLATRYLQRFLPGDALPQAAANEILVVLTGLESIDPQIVPRYEDEPTIGDDPSAALSNQTEQNETFGEDNSLLSDVRKGGKLGMNVNEKPREGPLPKPKISDSPASPQKPLVKSERDDGSED